MHTKLSLSAVCFIYEINLIAFVWNLATQQSRPEEHVSLNESNFIPNLPSWVSHVTIAQFGLYLQIVYV